MKTAYNTTQTFFLAYFYKFLKITYELYKYNHVYAFKYKSFQCKNHVYTKKL